MDTTTMTPFKISGIDYATKINDEADINFKCEAGWWSNKNSVLL